MTNRRADIIANLDKNLEDSIGLFKSLKPNDLNFQLYQDGACWTVKQVLAHFITIERSMHWLFNNILSGGPGSPEDFDFERFNRTRPIKLAELSFDELIREFRLVRKKTISMVMEMSEDDLDREGLHAFHGHGKLERFIRWGYEHVQVHENDIRMKLQIR